jgi:hypothetical protein
VVNLTGAIPAPLQARCGASLRQTSAQFSIPHFCSLRVGIRSVALIARSTTAFFTAIRAHKRLCRFSATKPSHPFTILRNRAQFTGL